MNPTTANLIVQDHINNLIREAQHRRRHVEVRPWGPWHSPTRARPSAHVRSDKSSIRSPHRGLLLTRPLDDR